LSVSVCQTRTKYTKKHGKDKDSYKDEEESKYYKEEEKPKYKKEVSNQGWAAAG
jgi:hypothetical protein